MSVQSELFPGRLWDSCLSEDAARWSCDSDLAVMLEESVQIYVPTFSSDTIHTYRWIKLITSRLDTNSRSGRKKQAYSSDISELAALRNDYRPLAFKSIEWSPVGIGLPERPVLATLLDDGSLLILKFDNVACENAIRTRISEEVPVDLFGLTIVSQVVSDFSDIKRVDLIAWMPKSSKVLNVKSSFLFCLSGRLINILQLSTSSPLRITKSSAMGVDIEHPKSIKVPINLENSKVAIIRCFSNESSRMDEEGMTLLSSCDMYICSSNGHIQRFELSLFTNADESLGVYFNSLWIIKPYDFAPTSLSLERSGDLRYSDDYILTAYTYQFCTIRCSTGQMAVAELDEKVVSAVFLPKSQLPLHLSNDVSANQSCLILSSTLDNHLQLWLFDPCQSILRNVVQNYRTGSNRIQSVCKDPHHMGLYFVNLIPPEIKVSRETQQNIKMYDTSVVLSCTPVASVLYDMTKDSLNTLEKPCLTRYIEEFSVSLQEFCLASFASSSLPSSQASATSYQHDKSLGAMVYYVAEMVNRFDIGFPPDDWGKSLNLPPLSELNNPDNAFPIEDNDVSSSDTDSDRELEDEVEEPTKKARKSTEKKGRISKEEAIRRRKDRKKRSGGHTLMMIANILRARHPERLNATLSAFFESACEVAAIINSKQAKTSTILLATSPDEAMEILCRMTTDDEPSSEKMLLWQACHAVFRGTFRVKYTEFNEESNAFLGITSEVQRCILVAEAMKTLTRAINMPVRDLLDEEKLSIFRRIQILESYSNDRRSGFVVTMNVAASAKSIFSLAESFSPPAEQCPVCGSGGIIFQATTPLQSLCSECGVMLDRCMFTYQILDLDDTVDIVRDGAYQPERRLLQCSLCLSGATNIAEKRYLLSSGSHEDVYSWIFTTEFHRCVFCSISLSMV